MIQLLFYDVSDKLNFQIRKTQNKKIYTEKFNETNANTKWKGENKRRGLNIFLYTVTVHETVAKMPYVSDPGVWSDAPPGIWGLTEPV